jgi:hypothetical protein
MIVLWIIVAARSPSLPQARQLRFVRQLTDR